jgi:hypothetical protein
LTSETGITVESVHDKQAKNQGENEAILNIMRKSIKD